MSDRDIKMAYSYKISLIFFLLLGVFPRTINTYFRTCDNRQEPSKRKNFYDVIDNEYPTKIMNLFY